MKRFQSHGATMDYKNETGTTISNGQVVLVGNMLGIAHDEIPDGEIGVLHTEGVHRVPKVPTAVIGKGEPAMWDVSESAFNADDAPAEGDLLNSAVAWEPAGDGDTEVDVKINVGVGELQPGA